MKQGIGGGKNIAFNQEAQAQIQADRAARMKAEGEPKVVVDSAYTEQERRQKAEDFTFKDRSRDLARQAESDAIRLADFEAKAKQLESFDGYRRHFNMQTIAGVERQPTPEDWTRQRDDRRAYADSARETLYASSHASEILKWAADKPEPLKTAIGAVKRQILAERPLLDQAAAEVNRLWIQSPSSPELQQAQAALGLKTKVVQRLERSLQLIERGN